MLRKRLIVIIFLIPALALLLVQGGWWLTGLMTLLLSTAAWEFGRMFTLGGYQPATILLIVGSGALVILRYLFGIDGSLLVLMLLFLVIMTYHVVQYEQGNDQAALNFTISICGVLYIGWLGGYVISMREASGGQWWLLLIFPAVWFTDLGGYLIGRGFGRHKLSHRVSPKKSWEGYAGGIVFSALATWGLAWLWQFAYAPLEPQMGLIIGLIIGIITPLGDLGESMLKRQFGVKDSSNLLPGHGGVLDRIDSWLWAAVIGYYLVTVIYL